MQGAYKADVEEWIAAIRAEQALASVNHSTLQERGDPHRGQDCNETIRYPAQKIFPFLAICTITTAVGRKALVAHVSANGSVSIRWRVETGMIVIRTYRMRVNSQ